MTAGYIDSSLAAFIVGIAAQRMGRRPVASTIGPAIAVFAHCLDRTRSPASMETLSPIAERRNIRRCGSDPADITSRGKSAACETRFLC
jgi:hypothetical protein